MACNECGAEEGTCPNCGNCGEHCTCKKDEAAPSDAPAEESSGEETPEEKPAE